MLARQFFGLLALLFILWAPAASAQTAPLPTVPTCFPPPIDKCGKGAVHGTAANGVEWSAWWIEHNFEWARTHWYRLPTAALLAPPPGTMSIKTYAAALWQANIGDRSCDKNMHPEAAQACKDMATAANASRPPEIWYDVAAATSADGTRPGYRRTATNTLVLDGTRHKAGAWCECWRGALKPGTSQYCVVYQTESYTVCKRVQ